jgi:hypothetical protein
MATMEKTGTVIPKKPYSSPTLWVHGDIEKLTQSNTHTGGTVSDTRGTFMDLRTH